MKTATNLMSITVVAAALYTGTACADALDWYMQQLFEPSGQQLEMERQGRVMIYEGLRDTDVERALDEQFGRVESMMFTGTVVTDEEGAPLLNRETGEVLVENDGC